MAVSEEQKVETEVQGDSQPRGNPSDGSISVGQGPESLDPEIAFGSAVALHVCCCNHSQVSGME